MVGTTRRESTPKCQQAGTAELDQLIADRLGFRVVRAPPCRGRLHSAMPERHSYAGVSPRLRAERTARARATQPGGPSGEGQRALLATRNSHHRTPAQSHHAATDQVFHDHRQGLPARRRPRGSARHSAALPGADLNTRRPKRLPPGTQPKVERASPLGSTANQPVACNAVAARPLSMHSLSGPLARAAAPRAAAHPRQSAVSRSVPWR